MGDAQFSRYLLIVLLLRTVCSQTLVSSTFKNTEFSLKGVSYEYLVLDIDYEEDLYSLAGSPCSCTQDSVDECFNGTTIETVVDETGYDVIELTEDTWVEYKSSEVMYFKFTLEPTEENPCPIAAIEWNHGGSWVGIRVSNDEIPSKKTYQWSQVSWAPGYKTICSSDPFYGFGTYYIGVFPDTIGKPSNFKLRYSTGETKECDDIEELEPQSEEDYEELEIEWEWIYDGLYMEGVALYDDYKYYRLLLDEDCVDIGISVRSVVLSDADFDLYISRYEDPYLDDFVYEWTSFDDGDDNIAIANLCKPDDLGEDDDFILYISVYSYRGSEDGTPFHLVASTDADQIKLLPLTSWGERSFETFLFDSFSLHCGDEELYCSSAQYADCDSEPYRCCFPLNYAHPSTKGSNPLVVSNTYSDELAALTRSDFDMAYPEIVPGRFSVGIMTARRTPTTYEQYFHGNISECTGKFYGTIVIEDGSPLTDEMSFTERSVSCDYEKFHEWKDNYTNAITEVEEAATSTLLSDALLNLNFLFLDDIYYDCRDNMKEFISYENKLVKSYTEQYSCYDKPGTDAFYESACCNYQNRLDNCCSPSSFDLTQSVPTDTITDNLESQCSVGTCSSYRAEDLIGNAASAYKCIEELNNEVGEFISSNPSAFVYDCRKSLMSDDNGGRTCESDSDCVEGSSCDEITHRCDHGIDEIFDCFAESIDPKLGQLLFAQWELTSEYSQAEFISELNSRLVIDECTGPGSVVYQDHIQYTREQNTCEDDCVLTDVEPNCFENTCDVPDICVGSPDGSQCYRFFASVAGISGCEEEKRCSWMDCTGVDGSTCVDDCDVGGFACVLCDSNGVCTELPGITDEETCNLGVCNLDKSITDASSCSSIGVCSSLCNGTACADQTECESEGSYCSDIDYLSPWIIDGWEGEDAETIGQDGLCISPFIVDFYGGAGCESYDYYPAFSGCVQYIDNQEECEDYDYVWYELAVDQATCENSETKCYSDYYEVFNAMDESKCDVCSLSYGPIFEWIEAEWTEGEMLTTSWVSRQATPIRSEGQTIDYLKLYEELENSYLRPVAFAYSTESLCLHDTEVNAIDTIACDCLAGNSDCHTANAVETRISVNNICPFIQYEIEGSNKKVFVPKSALDPEDLCQVLTIYQVGVQQFLLQSTAALSSDVFSSTFVNEYAIIEDTSGDIIGQLGSSGIRVEIEASLLDAISVCIIPLVDAISTRYVDPVFVELVEDKFIILNDIETYSNGEYICGNFSEAGTYFVAYLESGAQGISFDIVLRYIVSVIYFIVTIFAVVQGVQLKFEDQIVKKRDAKYNLKFIVLTIVILFSGTRGVYMLFPGDIPAWGTYLFFELPSFFFFTIYATILYLWVEISWLRKKVSRESQVKELYYAFLGFNVVIYIVFIIFILMFTFWPSTKLPCELTESLNEEKALINLVYLILIGVVTGALSISFLVAGIQLVIPLLKSSNSKKSVKRAATFTTIFTLCFLIKSILYLWSGIAGEQLPLYVFVPLEIIPALGLLSHIRPPCGCRKMYREYTVTRGTSKRGDGGKIRKRKK
eukprot:TRINITY_DN9694_c0_g1_i1.p1 TRINITY_DN9694_c0_g1~~TRINITY_DN9694_c0_g1_i1.p1  ORF type:complete len:1560 (-),score=423.92 TRINITY_DN9694_c0_g1_i1:67-4746(-)